MCIRIQLYIKVEFVYTQTNYFIFHLGASIVVFLRSRQIRNSCKVVHMIYHGLINIGICVIGIDNYHVLHLVRR